MPPTESTPHPPLTAHKRRPWWELNLSSRLTLIFGLLGAVAIAVSLAYSFVASRAALQQEIDARLNRHTLTVSTLLAHRLQRLDVFLQSAGARRVLNELDRSSAPIQVTARDLALVFQEISVGGDVEIFFVLDAAGQLVIDNGRLDMASLLVSMGSPVQFAGGWRLKSLPAGHVLLRSVPLFEPASLVISGYLFAGLPLSDQSPFVKEWFANTTLDRFVMGHESDILLVAHRDLPSQQSVSVPAFWGLWDDQGLHVRESQLAVPGLIDPIWLELEISRKQLTGLMTGHLLTGMGLTGAFLLLLLMFGAWVKVYHDKAVSRLMGYIRAVQAGQRGVHFQETGIYEYNQVGFAMEDMVEDLHVAATVFDSADGMIVTDRSLHVLRANRSFGLMLGTDHRGLSGRDLFEVLAGVDPDSSRPTVMERLARKGTWRGDVNGRRSNGAEIAMRVALSEVRGGRRQEVMNYVVTVTDVSRQKADAARIRQLAYFDPLTALPNRRLQMDRLERALSDSQISQQFGAILYLDLDDFKSLNDTRGHASGDHLLVQVAQRLTLAVRQGDSVARMGGDEFVVLLQHLGAEWGAAQARALSVAQAVLDSLRQPVEMDEGEHHCTGSIGVTLFCGDQLSVEELLQQADLAMYEAKSSGRNAVRLFQPEMSALALRRVNLEQELRRALANEEFVIFFQPIWTDQDTVTGAEVLLRWNHPEGGLRSGGEIIPVAEKSGLILPLGQWVLQQACHTLATWGQDARHQHWTLAVNVSVKQFQQPDFVTLVMDCVQRSGCNPARLFLELTESMFLDVRESDIETMRRLRQIGVRFSLDDFGTGYSSLAYLKSLPLDALKIDGTFVKDLGSDATSDDFVRTIVSLARALQLDVVAEGVETPHQRQRLVACGCVRFQGFLLGRPVPLSEMMSLLK